jgi:hypothetical protein
MLRVFAFSKLSVKKSAILCIINTQFVSSNLFKRKPRTIILLCIEYLEGIIFKFTGMHLRKKYIYSDMHVSVSSVM